MTGLISALRTTPAQLRVAGLPSALVGGLAVAVRTEPRFTRDIDLAVTVGDDASAERLVHALRSAGFGITAALAACEAIVACGFGPWV